MKPVTIFTGTPGNRTPLCIVLILTAMILSPELSARFYRETYQVAMDDVNWQLTEKKYFNCRLYQEVPLFGAMAISASAGHQLTIELISSLFPQVPDVVQLWLDPLPWGSHQEYLPGDSQDRSGRPVSIARFIKPEGMQPEGLELRLTQPVRQFLQTLNNHSLLYLLVIKPPAAFGKQEKEIDRQNARENLNGQAGTMIEVSIPTLGMLPALRKMSGCVANLLPRNFQQLRRYNLYYPSGRFQPDPAQRQWLVDTVRYLSVDKTITGITIDGHSDDTPFKQTRETLSRLKNLELSKKRASAVSQLLQQYLQEAGITRPLVINVRHHGERYPVANNVTAAGRYQNRRVEISLERNVPGKTGKESTQEKSPLATNQ
ncbi:OmpA family protein [Endozoicomonas sp.]|uniref:OmpA family protein n=1 Tax=Endozoicomonas sp. TaxID=1892382 RepID=UPI00383B8D20